MTSGVVTQKDGGIATTEAGVVMLDGPDGVAVTMTPEAARETADSLNDAADEAREQKQA